jgi:UDP-N-acetylmuramate dehydrogenase
VPLSEFTTWRVGGPARWLLRPAPEEVPKVLRACAESQVPVLFLGRGSNLLVSDAGFPGLVIATADSMRTIEIRNGRLRAGAGASLPSLAKAARRLGWSGYEFLLGIPGTVGGGIAMNCGVERPERTDIGSVVATIEISDASGPLVLERSEMGFAYRSSRILTSHMMVTAAEFEPRPILPDQALRRASRARLEDRLDRQPRGVRTAGSTFKQPEGGRPAGWYIERCDLKGTAIGGASVSMKHANWIETREGARAGDVFDLICLVRSRVRDVFQIDLEPEVRIIGEDWTSRTRSR